jgi:hypothetical protein
VKAAATDKKLTQLWQVKHKWLVAESGKTLSLSAFIEISIMKKLIFSAFGLAAMLGLHSCSEDFEVAAPYKDITVAYGMMNIADTAHYFRIQKAFLDEHKSAIDMAKVADSNFYQSLDVKVREINTATGSVLSTTSLNRVDLINEGYPKQPGAFFEAPSYAYKYKKTLNANYTYRLVITNTATGQVDSAQTAVLSDDPSLFYVTQFNQLSYTIGFVNSNPNLKFAWNPVVPPLSAYYEGIIRFHWVDKNTQTNVQTDHYADWTWSTKTKDDNLKMEMTFDLFYSFLADAIGPAPANTERYMDSCDLFVWAADTTYYNYRRFVNAQGGITADEIKPTYTNFRSNTTQKGVLGILASRAVKSLPNVPINDVSIESLKSNALTRNLNVKGRSDH